MRDWKKILISVSQFLNSLCKKMYLSKIALLFAGLVLLNHLRYRSGATVSVDCFLHLFHQYLSRCVFFLVACYATLHPAMSVRRSVSRSVGRLVGWSVPFLLFRHFLALRAYGPCPDVLVPALLLPIRTRLGKPCIRPC